MGAPILAPFFWTLTVITEYCTQLHYTSNGATIVEFLPEGGGERGRKRRGLILQVKFHWRLGLTEVGGASKSIYRL